MPISPGPHSRPVVVEDLHVGAGPGPADRARVREPLLRAHHRAAALGGAVVLVDHRSPPLEHRALELDRARRRRVHHVAQRGDVVLRAHVGGQPHESLELRRHHVGGGDAVPLDQRERALGVPAVHQHHGMLEVQREVAERERRHVVHRRRHEVDVVAARLDVVAVEVRREHRDHLVGIERGNRAAHRLRAARGARRVLHELAREPRARGACRAGRASARRSARRRARRPRAKRRARGTPASSAAAAHRSA